MKEGEGKGEGKKTFLQTVGGILLTLLIAWIGLIILGFLFPGILDAIASLVGVSSNALHRIGASGRAAAAGFADAKAGVGSFLLEVAIALFFGFILFQIGKLIFKEMNKGGGGGGGDGHH